MNFSTQPDIYLLGSGILSFIDITLMTQRILKECKKVFYLHDVPTFERYMKKISRNAVNLLPVYYLEGRDRLEIYEDIVRHVLESSKKEKPVALLLHGHPLFFTRVSRRLLEESDKNGISMEVLPGVSSLDRMVVYLKLDIGPHGIQIMEASTAILKDITLNPRLECILYQVGAILSPISARLKTSTPEQATALKNYLLKFYPGKHVVKILESALELGYQSRITAVEIATLEEHARFMTYTASLYVPSI